MGNAAATTEENPAAQEGGREKVRARLLVLLAVLVPLNAYWLALSEVIRYAGHPTTTSLFYNVVFWLAALVLGNGICTRITRRPFLNRGELLIAYSVLGVTSALGSHDIVEVLLPTLVHATQFQNAANDWANILLPNLPDWLVVKNVDAAKDFYTGHSTLYNPAHLRAWALPILSWVGFLGTLTGTLLCVNVLFRRQWTEQEKLAFPLVNLPLAMTGADNDATMGGKTGSLWQNKAMWVGFAGAALLQLWNGWAFLNPAVPGVSVKYQDIAPTYFNGLGRPWNAIGWTPVSFYPFALGLGLLLPTDFLFSSWFFFWFWKGQNVLAAATGWDQTPGFPYVGAQSLGAFLGITITVLWAARKRLSRIFALAIGDAKGHLDEDNSGGPISYQAAFWGMVSGLCLLGAFCFAAGMVWWAIILFFAIYLAIALAVTRMRAELGPPAHDLHHSGPDEMLPTVLGPSNFDRHTLSVFSLAWGFNRAYRAHPMPVTMESFKLAERAQTPTVGVLFPFLLAAGFVGPLCAFWALLHLGYQNGAASAAIGPPNVLTIFGGEAWNRYGNWVNTPKPPQPAVGMGVIVGAGFTLLLNLLRVRVVGFPFHPVGYAVASSWGMGLLWMPMFLAWLIKITVLRYGGLLMYRRLLPVCYGVILGECVTGSLWSLFSMATGIPTYAFWP